jgi:tetratricopeptide (TPR) repeat protein
MLENVLILGELGQAVFENEGGLFALDVDSDRPTVCRAGDISLLLDSGGEVEEFEYFSDVDRLREELQQTYARHRALSFTLSGLDSDLSGPTRSLCIEAAEELCQDGLVRDFVRHRLLARPLPETAEIIAGVEFAKLNESHIVRSIYEETADSQVAVRTVHDSWREVSLREFSMEREQLVAEKTLADHGVFANLATAVACGDRNELSSAVVTFGVNPSLRRRLPRISFLLADLCSGLLGSAIEFARHSPNENRFEEHEEEDQLGDHVDPVYQLLSQISDENSAIPERRSAIEIKLKVDKQIGAITVAINRGELDRAEAYLHDLIAFHVHHDRREHIAMSLSALATVALDVNRLDLARRLLSYAEYVNPVDPVLDAQRGQLLLRAGQVQAALEAFDRAISRFPDNVFARNGRAEVLKETGRLTDALAAYDETIGRFPDDVVARNGRATVLIFLDRISEARLSLPRSPVTKQEWIGYHILCMSYLRQLGDVEEAIKYLEHGARTVPWKPVRMYFDRALALALIRKREFEAAAKLLSDEAIIVEAARSQVSLLLLAHSHAEMGRRSEALGNLMQLTGSVAPDLRKLQSALMTRYQLASPTAQPSQALSWLEADIADREFKLVLAAA